MELLIADDDLSSRTMLAAETKKWGYVPILAEDGEEAWSVLQETDKPFLLLIDWDMPKLNGPGLCLRVRESYPTNPPYIILLTAKKDINDIVTGLEAGANNYIFKPFVYEELLAHIQVGQRMLELQSQLQKSQDLLTYEREVIENIILKMRASKPFENRCLRILDSPVQKTSGDVLLSAFRPDNTRYVMMGDFTGHGLMAAVGGPIVFDIFYTMTAKGIGIKEIATEINGQLIAKMPTGMFLGAIFIELSADNKLLSIWNCGMSDILIYRQAQLWKKISSSMMALGIINQTFEPVAQLNVESGDRIYAYSDGIIEVINDDEQAFGQQRLEQTLHHMLTENKGIDFLADTISQFRGIKEQFDDITLVELTC